MAYDESSDAGSLPSAEVGRGAHAREEGSSGSASGGQPPRRDRISTTFPQTPPEIASTVDTSGFVPAVQLSKTPPPTGRPHYHEFHTSIGTFVVCILATLLVAGILFVTLFPWPCTVTVNGRTVESNVHASLETLVEQGAASPKPGDYLAIDGSLLGEDGGYPFTATVNGESQPNLQASFHDGDVIDITDGGNLVEDAIEERLPIYPPVTFEGVGAVHRYAQVGSTGEKVRRTGAVSGIVQEEVVAEPTAEVMEKFNVETGDDKVIALTFDDGPWKDQTAEILDVLADNDAKATFFTVGDRIEGLEDVVRRAAEEGHQVCTHSWDHAAGDGKSINLDLMSEEQQRQEMALGLEAIEKATGAKASTVVRVPGGNLSENTARILGEFATAEIGWNLDTSDWTKPGAEAIFENIMLAEPGDILLMHDGGGDRSQTVQALRDALPRLREAGYRFVTVDELLAYAD